MLFAFTSAMYAPRTAVYSMIFVRRQKERVQPCSQATAWALGVSGCLCHPKGTGTLLQALGLSGEESPGKKPLAGGTGDEGIRRQQTLTQLLLREKGLS